MSAPRRILLGLALFAGCGAPPGEELPLTVELLTEAVPDGTVGLPYLAEIEAAAPEGARLEWAILSNGLPRGLALTSRGSFAELSGTPEQAGETTFLLRVVDADSGVFDERDFTVSVVRGERLAILPASLPPATVGQAYEAEITARGGADTAYRWRTDPDPLPRGFAIEAMGVPSTRLTGTPTTAGQVSFRLAVTDAAGMSATRDFALEVVEPQALAIRASLREGGVVGAPYALDLSVVGGEGVVTWTSTGAIPGTRLVPAGRAAVIEGVPTEVGLFEVRIFAEDTVGAQASFTYQQRIVPRLAIETEDIPAAVLGDSYTGVLEASQGAGGHTWRVAQGSLPNGLSLAARGATLGFTGQPTTLGEYDVVFEVRDAAAQTATRAFTLEVVEPLEVLTTSLPDGVLGTEYEAPLSARGGRLPLRWLILRGAPPGIEIEASETRQSRLLGIAGRRGLHVVVVQTIDADGRTTGKNLGLQVDDSGQPLSISPTSSINTRPCEGFSRALQGSGGSNFGYRWTVSGPTGVAVEGTGTPGTMLSGLVDEPGEHTLTVTLEDTDRSQVTRDVTLWVGDVADDIELRYAVARGSISGSPALLVLDTCRRDPAVIAQFPLPSNAAVAATFTTTQVGNWLTIAGAVTSTTPRVYVTDLAPPVLVPVSGADTLRTATPTVRMAPWAPRRVFYEARRPVEVSPNVVMDADVVRYVDLDVAHQPSPPRDAHAPDPTATARLLNVDAYGRAVVYGDPGHTVNVARPDDPSPLRDGVSLGSGGARHVKTIDSRTEIFETGLLQLADLSVIPPRVDQYYPVLEVWPSPGRTGRIVSRRLDPTLGRVLAVSEVPTLGSIAPPRTLPGSEACGQSREDVVVSNSRAACVVASPPAGAASPLLRVWNTETSVPAPFTVPAGPQGALAEGLQLVGDDLFFVASPVPQLGPQVYALKYEAPNPTLDRLTPRAASVGTTYTVRPWGPKIAVASSSGDLTLVSIESALPVTLAELPLSLPEHPNVWRVDGSGLFVQTSSGLGWVDLLSGQPTLRPIAVGTGVTIDELLAYER